jgi:hypothetical protein
LIMTICTLCANAQDIAMSTFPASNRPFYTLEDHTGTTDKHHKQSALSTAGTCIMLGGVVVTILGVIEVKNGTTTDGPFTITNQNQINAGHMAEFAGAGIFVGGLIMVLASGDHKHSQHSKVTLATPKGNQLGITYNF